MCGWPCQIDIASKRGTVVSILQKCHSCQFKWTWYSQLMISNVTAGNILMSAAIMFIGSSAIKFLVLQTPRNTEEPVGPIHEEKFLVLKSCLWELFKECSLCGWPYQVEIASKRGTVASILQKLLSCQYKPIRYSQ